MGEVEKKLGVEDFDEEGVVMNTALEDAKGGGAIDSIRKEQSG